MPTRTQVNDWQLGKLSEWAGELEKSTQLYEAQLGRMLVHFTNTAWSGKAKDAASDRFSEEHDQGRRLTQEILDVATALRAAETRLAVERDALLGRVADAEADTTSPLTLRVADNWVVESTLIFVGNVSEEDLAKVRERIDHHQGLINAAYYSLVNAASEAATSVTAASQEIRVRGDQLANGIDAPATDFSEAGRLGAEDGKAVADALNPNGTVDRAVLDRIASQLPAGILSENDLKILAEGGEVSTLPASVQDYYREFYQNAGKDGLLAMNEQLRKQEEAGNPLAAGRRDALANGLLVVSNEKVGTGRNPDGTLRSPGGYENVPKPVRDLIETRFPIPENDDADPRNGARPYRQPAESARLGEIASLSDLLGQSNPGYQPGTKMGTEMIEQSAYLMSDVKDDLKGVPYVGDVSKQFESTAARLVDVGGRNEESAYQILTGDGMPPDYKPDKAVSALLGNDWSNVDQGHGASQLLDWIGPDSHSTDELQADRARAALAELPGLLAPEENGVLTEDFREYNENFAKNPELSTALSKALQGNLGALGDINNPNGYSVTKVLEEAGAPDRVTLRASEADRLLMLANQSEEGRVGLQTAVNLNQQEVINNALGGDPQHNAQVGAYLGTLAGRVDAGMNNALLFQEHQEIIDKNERLQSSYESKMKGAEIASELIQEAIPFKRGGPLGEAAGQLAVGEAADALINAVIKEPELESVPLKYSEDILNADVDTLRWQILTAELQTAGSLPPGFQDQNGRPLAWSDLNARLQNQATGIIESRGFSLFDEGFTDSYRGQTPKFFSGEDQLNAFLDGAYTPEAKASN
ncbi:hypothetical protein APR11_004784 [Nocardia amikacinitolerans]|uniref:TPR repeat region-containing protein n=1 Tax=Nocardia amikacinitolerans TaxID=756689 RepID=UPI0020A34678|nr:hypothetical protein [Nocardia amikacinitolerans]MCP2298339.1 hypothetical protein [Nocardia amikacinitolerans]